MTVEPQECSQREPAEEAATHRAVRMWQQVEFGISGPDSADLEVFRADHPELDDAVGAARRLYREFRYRRLQASPHVLIAAYLHLAQQDRTLVEEIYARFDQRVGFAAADETSDFGLYVLITRLAVEGRSAADAHLRAETQPTDGLWQTELGVESDAFKRGWTVPLPTDGPWGPVLDAQPLADGIIAVETRRRRGLVVSSRCIVGMPRSLCPAGTLDGDWVWVQNRPASLVRLVHATELGITGSVLDELELAVARRMPLRWARWKSGTDTRPATLPFNVTFHARNRLQAVMVWLPRSAGRVEATDWLVAQGLDRDDLADQVWVNPDAQAFATERPRWPGYALGQVQKYVRRLRLEEDAGSDVLITRLALDGWKRYARFLGVPERVVDAAVAEGTKLSSPESVVLPDPAEE